MDKDIQDEFNKIDINFDKVQVQFGKVNEQFIAVNQRVDKAVEFLQTKVALKTDLEEFVTKDELKIQLGSIHNKLDKILTFHEGHHKTHVVIDHRLDVLEAKVGVS